MNKNEIDKEHTVEWQLPVYTDQRTNEQHIHKKAKYHAYDEEGVSLCKRHTQEISEYEDYELNEIIKKYGKNHICPTCLDKYKRIQERCKKLEERIRLNGYKIRISDFINNPNRLAIRVKNRADVIRISEAFKRVGEYDKIKGLLSGVEPTYTNICITNQGKWCCCRPFEVIYHNPIYKLSEVDLYN